MRITGCETLHCGAGWRNFSFLKLQTDGGLTGIAEYNESYGSKGLTGVIEALVELHARRDTIRGLRIVESPPSLPHFTARYAEVDP